MALLTEKKLVPSIAFKILNPAYEQESIMCKILLQCLYIANAPFRLTKMASHGSSKYTCTLHSYNKLQFN